MKKMKLDHLLTLHSRMKSKWIKDLNIRLDTINILKENVGSKVLDISCGSVFSDMSPWARVKKKQTINKWDYIKLKSFCTAKETISKMKREPL